MPMHVNDASAGGGAGQMKVAERGGAQGADAGRGFLETYRKLPDASFQTSPTGLKVATVREGSGTSATSGVKLKVQYTGWLEDGTQFDTSLKRSKPFEFTLGAGRVIKGWEEGLAGIKPGERRQIVIPAPLGYGDRSVGEIPPGSTLVFNVEAVAVEPPGNNPKGNMTVVA